MTFHEKRQQIVTPKGVQNKSPIHYYVSSKSTPTTLSTPILPPSPKYHKSLHIAWNITDSDIEEIFVNSEEPEQYKQMFKFLDFYTRLSDLKKNSKAMNDEINFYSRLLKHKLIDIIMFYKNQSLEYREIAESCLNKKDIEGYKNSMDLSKRILYVSERLQKLNKSSLESRTDKLLFIDSISSFSHTSGSIIPLLFGISDYGSAEYWPQKLLDYLRNNR